MLSSHSSVSRLFPLIIALAAAAVGCSSAQRITLRATAELARPEGTTPIFSGKVGIVPFRDDRSLPFHAPTWTSDGAYFGKSAAGALQDVLIQTLREAGVYEDVVVLDGEDALLEPSPERLRQIADQYSDVDVVISAAVQHLNISSQHLGSGQVKVGKVTYKDLAYYGHRCRMRVQMEAYSLRYNQLLWGDVIDGESLEAAHDNTVDSLVNNAYTRFCNSLIVSLGKSATRVVRDGTELRFTFPDQTTLVAAAIAIADDRVRLLGEDVTAAHAKGTEHLKSAAQDIWKRAVQRIEMTKTVAGFVNAIANEKAKKAEAKGKKHEGLQPVDMKEFEEQIEALGVNTGSSVIAVDAKKARILGISSQELVTPAEGAKVTYGSGEFSRYDSAHFVVLSQVGPGESALIARTAERVLAAYIREYGHRNQLAERLSRELPGSRPKEKKAVLLMLRSQKKFEEWCDRSGHRIARSSGGFWSGCRPEHLQNSGIESNAMSEGSSRKQIVLFWDGQLGQDGKPMPATETLWGALPHEIGHHVNNLLLDGNVPPFQSDGFTTYHEYPVDFAGQIRFGQFVNPTNESWLRQFREHGVLSLDDLVDRQYEEISDGGKSFKGYTSVWLYYQYLSREHSAKLAEYEARLVHRDESQSFKSVFREVFDLDSDEELAEFGSRAVAWARAQDIGEEDLKRAHEAYQSVVDGAPRSYNYRIRRSMYQPR